VKLASLALIASLAAAPAADEGIRLIAQGKTREAILFYQARVSQVPTDAGAQTGLGIAYERAGRTAEAREAYEKALRIDASDVRAMNNLANLLVEKELDIPRAKKLLKRVLQLRPNLATGWDNLGWAFYKEKNYGQARKHFKRALDLDPSHASAQYHMGLAHLNDNDLAAAKPYLERAVRLDPANARGSIALGLCLQKMGQRQEAHAAYQQAMSRVDRRSAIGREVTRLMASLGSTYGSGGNLLSSPDALFSRYPVDRAPMAAPFASMNQYTAPGQASLETGIRSPESGVRSPEQNSVPPLPSERSLGGPTPLTEIHRPNADGSPPIAGLPPAVAARRAARLAGAAGPRTQEADEAAFQHLHGEGTSTDHRPSTAHTLPPPRQSPEIDPRTGSLILSRRVPSEPPDSGLRTPASPSVSSKDVRVSESLLKQDLVEQHLRMAHLYEQHGLWHDAVSEGQTVINLAPWSKEAGEARDVVARLGKKEEAEPAQRVYGLLKLGEKFYAEHQIEPAILQYEKVLVVAPQHPIAFKNLAFLNVRAGRLDVAYDQIKKCLELEPDFQEALLIKGHIEARHRRFRASYDTFKRLAELAREGTPMRQYASGLMQKMRRFVELE
jgi:tetratricopeptide (TPR) repeat protein